MKLLLLIFLIFELVTNILGRPPSSSSSSSSSSHQITGGIGDGFIYPAKSKPKSTTTYYAKPLHPHPKGGPSKPKPQVYKIIIHDQPAKKAPRKHEQIFKIVHLPQHAGGGGGGGGGHHAASLKILKIIQIKQQSGGGGGGQHHSAGKWSK